jgi:hypothetical protein
VRRATHGRNPLPTRHLPRHPQSRVMSFPIH